jgi:hypothetical protein
MQNSDHDTQKRQEYSKKYRESKYDRIEFMVPKGQRQAIKDHAAKFQPQLGETGRPGYSPKGSVTAFINRAIHDAIEKDIAINCIKEYMTHARIMEEAVKLGIVKPFDTSN